LLGSFAKGAAKLAVGTQTNSTSANTKYVLAIKTRLIHELPSTNKA